MAENHELEKHYCDIMKQKVKSDRNDDRDAHMDPCALGDDYVLEVEVLIEGLADGKDTWRVQPHRLLQHSIQIWHACQVSGTHLVVRPKRVHLLPHTYRDFFRLQKMKLLRQI